MKGETCEALSALKSIMNHQLAKKKKTQENGTRGGEARGRLTNAQRGGERRKIWLRAKESGEDGGSRDGEMRT